MTTVEQLKTIVEEQANDAYRLFATENMVERENLGECAKFLSHPNILLVAGARRAGKSVFAQQLLRGRSHACLNFDDERLAGMKTDDLNRVLEAFYSLYGSFDTLIFDEIQNVPGWELFVNRLQRGNKVVITGSNATLMSAELATRLTGRHIDFALYPFSFREYLAHKAFAPNSTTKDAAKTKSLLADYMKTGGFPEAQKFGNRFLLRLYEDVILRDVVGRFPVKFVAAFKELANLLMSNVGCEVTYTRLRKLLGIKSVHTVRNYMEHLESSLLILRLERFSPRLKERMLAPKKVYAVDSGLANAVVCSATPNLGRQMENVVFVELLRHKAGDPRIEVFYWRNHQQKEVDFVLTEGGRATQLVQVSYSLDEIERKDREIHSLLKAASEFKCRNLLFVTWEHEGQEKAGSARIDFVPLWKWLCRKERR